MKCVVSLITWLPRPLNVSGLTGAVEDLCILIKKQGLDCELEIIGLKEELLKKQMVNIYRIVQELCNNALKHANASSLFVQLFQKNDTLFILVEDDGKGFDFANASQQKSLGLFSVSSRVKAMNGEIHWDTNPGEGTAINIKLPIDNSINTPDIISLSTS